jgi:Ca2+-binding RTX toxin-like protein
VKRRSPLRYLIYGLLALIILTSLTAVAATNTIPSTRLAAKVISFNINHLKPSVCSGISVATLITGTGTITGTAGNDLILGSYGDDVIDGLGGDDCILGGGGDDIIYGGDGNDVCIGGTGTDTFTDCETEIQ